MNRRARLASVSASARAGLSTLLLLAACSSPPPPPPAAPPPPPPPVPPVAMELSPVAPTPPPEPTPEEKKKLEDAKKLEADFVKLDQDTKAETARWTPELHAEAKALSDKAYPDLKSAMKAVLAGKHRKPGHEARDKQRHPAETLAFFGVKPTMQVFEYGPGEGWYTEILAPTLAAKGKLVVNTADPAGARELRGTLYAQRLAGFLGTSSEAYGKVQPVIVGTPPKIGAEAAFDVALVFRGLHGMVNGKTLAAWLTEIHRTLKPGGVLGIEQHRAKDDASPEDSAKKGYLPQPWVISQIEAAGFKLAGKSEINANPKDTKDHPDGVWDLPPTLQAGDKDKDKYVAIGESDRMTLKFTKVVAKTPPKTDAKPPSAK